MGQDRNPNLQADIAHSEMDALLLGRTKELMDSGPDARNWRGIAISFLVIVVVCSLILMTIVLLSPVPSSAKRKARFTLKDIASNAFVPRDFNGTWISEKEFIFRNQEGSLVLYNAKEQNTSVIMPDLLFRQFNVDSYSLSSDSRYLLLLYNLPQTSTTSFILAEYKVYDRQSEEILPLLLQEPVHPLQHVEWGSTGSQMIYISENDIFYVPTFHGIPVPVTHTGSMGIQNGLTNWIYKERILKQNNALWWSEDGRMLCFMAFDDRNVNTTSVMWYGTSDPTGDAALQVMQLIYPKPGTPMTQVSLWVSDLQNASQTPVEVIPPKELRRERYYYITSVTWMDSNRLCVGWAKRNQKYSMLSICDRTKKWSCKKHVDVTGEKSLWVDFMEPPVFAEDKESYFVTLESSNEAYGSFQHVAMVHINKNQTFLTEGAFDVVKILGHHPQTRVLYYVSTLPGQPGQRHIFSVSDCDAEQPKAITCLTCHLAPDCLFNDALFSPKMQFYVLRCLGPNVPRIEIWTTGGGPAGWRRTGWGRMSLLDGNEELSQHLETKTLPHSQTFLVPLGGGIEAPVRLYLPPILDKEEVTKYPMVLYLDCRPGKQLITEEFSVDWGTYLGSKKHYIYVTADTRGSGHRGRRQQSQSMLGMQDVEDQITIVKYLINQLPFVDADHIAVWGWNFGAYISLMSLTIKDTPFCCGIFVAPIVSWRHYDAVFTERYLGVPSKDDSFDSTPVIRRIKQLKNKKLLIVHGTSDLHVHVQHSMFLIKALVDAGIVHRSQIYPDEEHYLTNVRYHLYRTMDTFLDQCFLVEEEPVITGLQKMKILISG